MLIVKMQYSKYRIFELFKGHVESCRVIERDALNFFIVKCKFRVLVDESVTIERDDLVQNAKNFVDENDVNAMNFYC